MAKSAGGGGDEGAPAPERLPQHPYVDRLKPDPSQPAKRAVDLVGLPGNSDRAGYQRLYLTTKLDYYAEFLSADMVYSEPVAADQSPFPGQEATRVSVDRDATIHYVWARSPQPVDEFDLDIRLGPRAAGPTAPGAAPALMSPLDGCQPVSIQQAVCPITPAAGCTPACTATCAGHATCPHTQCQTCQTCQTCQGQNTCAGHGTCVNTQCLQAACVFTQGGQGTCVTCVFTACNQGTCVNTACQQMTCVTCVVPGNTCAATCVV